MNQPASLPRSFDNISIFCERCASYQDHSRFREHLAIAHLGMALFSCDCESEPNSFFSQEEALKHRLYCGRPLKNIDIGEEMMEKSRQLDAIYESALSNAAHHIVFAKLAFINMSNMAETHSEEPISCTETAIAQPSAETVTTAASIVSAIPDVDPYASASQQANVPEIPQEIVKQEIDSPVMSPKVEHVVKLVETDAPNMERWPEPKVIFCEQKNFGVYDLNTEDPRLMKCETSSGSNNDIL